MYYRCLTAVRARRSVKALPDCQGGYQHTDEAVIDEAVRAYLEIILADEQALVSGEVRSRHAHINQLVGEVTDLDAQLAAMIDEQAARKGTARALYTAKIDAMGERLDILKSAHKRALEALQGEEVLTHTRRSALGEVRLLTVEGTMALSHIDRARYNQILAVLIKHIVVKDSEIAIVL